jgi:glycosyltransferase involved in cell wall biosynthesis
MNSITSQKYPREKFEIIIVDDGSKDDTISIAKRAGADLILEIDPCFPGKARNIGVSKAKGNLLAFIDSDCEAEPGWLDTISKELQTLDAIGGPILNGNPQSDIAWAEYLMEFSGFHEYKKRLPINFIPSCNQVCRKDTFNLVGGYRDVGLSEDVFFGLSLKKAGIDLIFIPELKIRHLCRTDLNKFLINYEKLAKYSVGTSEEVPKIYRRLSKTRLTIPLFFTVKFGARTLHSIRAKKFLIFIKTFPYVIRGTLAFCKGVWNEMSKK